MKEKGAQKGIQKGSKWVPAGGPDSGGGGGGPRFVPTQYI